MIFSWCKVFLCITLSPLFTIYIAEWWQRQMCKFPSEIHLQLFYICIRNSIGSSYQVSLFVCEFVFMWHHSLPSIPTGIFSASSTVFVLFHWAICNFPKSSGFCIAIWLSLQAETLMLVVCPCLSFAFQVCCS